MLLKLELVFHGSLSDQYFRSSKKHIKFAKIGKKLPLQTLHYSTGFDILLKVWKISAKETQENHIKVLKNVYIWAFIILEQKPKFLQGS